MQMRRRTKSKPTKNNRFCLLPVGMVLLLAVIAIAKWSLADWQETNLERDTTRVRLVQHSIRPEMLLGDTNSSAGPSVQDGVWSVGDLIWNFENQTVDSQQLASEMRFAAQIATGIESGLPQHLSILDLVPEQLAVLKEVAGCAVRLIDFESVQVSVCYREVDGQRSTLGAKVANQQDEQHWQVITLTPRQKNSPTHEHLLPIAGVLATACQRFSKSGSLQCEVIETNVSLDDLLDQWQSKSWLVEPFASDELQLSTVWSCTRGAKFVHVRATYSPDKSRTTLVLSALNSL